MGRSNSDVGIWWSHPSADIPPKIQNRGRGHQRTGHLNDWSHGVRMRGYGRPGRVANGNDPAVWPELGGILRHGSQGSRGGVVLSLESPVVRVSPLERPAQQGTKRTIRLRSRS